MIAEAAPGLGSDPDQPHTFTEVDDSAGRFVFVFLANCDVGPVSGPPGRLPGPRARDASWRVSQHPPMLSDLRYVGGSQRYVKQYLDPGTNEDPARDGELLNPTGPRQKCVLC